MKMGRYISIRVFLTFSSLNQLKIIFIFWKAVVVIFICILMLWLILELLKYSENPLESTGESSCPWESFKYGDLDIFLHVSLCKSLIYGIWTPTQSFLVSCGTTYVVQQNCQLFLVAEINIVLMQLGSSASNRMCEISRTLIFLEH